MNTHCEVRLISDEPADKDELGGHQKVAAAMADLIRTESGGRSLALIGRYGSGKSTVIRLLTSMLRKPVKSDGVNAQVFVFDAWAHQGDPLRRTFLEDLNEFLEKSEWLSVGAFTKELESLAKRRVDSVSSSTPELTWPGGLVGLSLFAIPIGCALIGKSVYFGGVLLGVLPIIALAFIAFFVYVWPANGSSDNLPVLEIFWKKVREVTTTRAITTPEPTSVEFRRLFSRMLSAALKNANNRIVIVVDNLDRLDRDDALQILATMRAFFEPGSDSSLQDRVWLVVPFEPAWTQRLGETKSTTHEKTITAEAFLEKSFQARFYVSEPVLSNWKSFLLSQLAMSCPAHTSDFERIYFLYSRFVDRTKISPNPRSIKQFVNRLVVLHRIWGDTIPLLTQAAFIIFEREIRDKSDDLHRCDFIDRQTIEILHDKNWLSNFAALLFQLAPDTASQVLIQDDLRSALVDGNIEGLRPLISITGFDAVCQRFVREEQFVWEQNDASLILQAAGTLAALDRPEVHLLKPTFLRVKGWFCDSSFSANGALAIVSSFDDESREGAFRHFIAGFAAFYVGSSTESISVEKWFEAALTIIKYGQREFPNVIKEEFRVSALGNAYLDLLMWSRDSGEGSHILPFLVPKEGSDGIVESLLERLDDDSRSDENFALLDAIRDVNYAFPLERVSSSIATELTSYSSIIPLDVDLKLRYLFALAFRGAVEQSARQTFESIISDGQIMAYLARSGVSSRALIEVLAAMLICEARAPNPGPAGFSAWSLVNSICTSPLDHLNYVKDVVDVIADLRLFSEILDSLYADGLDRLSASVIVNYAERIELSQDDLSSLTFDDVRRLADLVSDEERRSFLSTLIKAGRLDNLIAEQPFNDNAMALYAEALDLRQSKPSDGLTAMLKSGLREIESAAWHNALTSGLAPIRLLSGLSSAGTKHFLARSFGDALETFLVGIFNGASSAPIFVAENWSIILDGLELSSQSVVMRNLRDLLINETGDLVGLLALFGKSLANSGVFEERADETIRLLFRKCLQTKEASLILWVRAVIQNQPKVVHAADPASISDLTDRLRELEADAEECGEDDLGMAVADLREVLLQVDLGRGSGKV